MSEHDVIILLISGIIGGLAGLFIIVSAFVHGYVTALRKGIDELKHENKKQD